MKKIITFLFMSLLYTTGFSQLHVDSLYDSKSELLIHKIVFEFDSISQQNVKTWAGQFFINANEALVSETSNQLVFNYIIDDFTFKSMGIGYNEKWYIRLVIKLKDNKMMLSYYDGGNVGGIRGTVFVQPRSVFFLSYFKNKEIINNKSFAESLIKVKKSLLNTSTTIYSSIINIKNNSW